MIWRCQPCRQLMFYPTVLAHPCAESVESLKANIALVVDKGIRQAMDVINACGGAHQVSVDAMDTLSVRLTCQSCREKVYFKQREFRERLFPTLDAPKAYTWRAAIRHELEIHKSNSFISEWHRLSSDLEPFIHKLEQQSLVMWAHNKVKSV
ncbi:hypothetical protein EIP86_001657 [Pleurotus ostreatoroseus]|nr:hypothetical protein EIP86_001657 [Pleurotus ostreatoroseus]